MIRAQGRMIRKTISESDSFASLSEKAQVLFCLLIPHFSAHGKQNGNPYTIKGVVCPKIPYFTIPVIEKCLAEITAKTDVKWFKLSTTYFIHSLNFSEHQELRESRMGQDFIPDCPEELRSTPGQVPDKSAYKIKVKVKEKVNIKGIPDEKYTTFFDTYPSPHKRGTIRESCYKLWLSLPEQDRIDAAAGVTEYAGQYSDPKFVASPSKYISKRLWEKWGVKTILTPEETKRLELRKAQGLND